MTSKFRHFCAWTLTSIVLLSTPFPMERHKWRLNFNGQPLVRRIFPMYHHTNCDVHIWQRTYISKRLTSTFRYKIDVKRFEKYDPFHIERHKFKTTLVLGINTITFKRLHLRRERVSIIWNENFSRRWCQCSGTKCTWTSSSMFLWMLDVDDKYYDKWNFLFWKYTFSRKC